MASNRHLGRIIVLQTLYEQEIRNECQDKTFKLEAVLRRNINRYKTVAQDHDFIKRLVRGIDAHKEALDGIIQPVAPEWPLDQIARMDRLILRIGTFELHYTESETPPKVVINEAVELAKAFGGENSSKFVNGVLGTVLTNKGGDVSKTQMKSSLKKEVKYEKT